VVERYLPRVEGHVHRPLSESKTADGQHQTECDTEQEYLICIYSVLINPTMNYTIYSISILYYISHLCMCMLQENKSWVLNRLFMAKSTGWCTLRPSLSCCLGFVVEPPKACYHWRGPSEAPYARPYQAESFASRPGGNTCMRVCVCMNTVLCGRVCVRNHIATPLPHSPLL
jgi:hypothetical protein